MRYFIAPIALLAVACGQPQMADQAAAGINVNPGKFKKVSPLDVCYDEDGNPINQDKPWCANSREKVAGSVEPNDGHDDPTALFIDGNRFFGAFGFEGSVMVGSYDEEAYYRGVRTADIGAFDVSVFHGTASHSRGRFSEDYTRPDLRVEEGCADDEVCHILWGDFHNTERTAIILVMGNGDNYVSEPEIEFYGELELSAEEFDVNECPGGLIWDAERGACIERG